MAKLKGIIERLEDVEESQRGLYVKNETTGKYELDTDLRDELARVVANKNEILAEKKKQQEQLDRYKGIDPEKAAAAQAKLDDLAKKELEAKGDYEQVKQQMVTQHKDELAKKDTEIAKKDKAIERLVIDAEVSRLMATDDEVKGVPGLVLPAIRGNIRIKEAADGSFVPEILAGGSPRVVGTEGRPMSMKEYLLELKGNKEYARAFDGTGSTGSGASASGAGGAASTITSRGQLKSVADKVAFVEKNGQAAFEALPD